MPERDGSVTISIGSAADGQGLETVMAQIAADSLGLSLDKVHVLHYGSLPAARSGRHWLYRWVGRR